MSIDSISFKKKSDVCDLIFGRITIFWQLFLRNSNLKKWLVIDRKWQRKRWSAQVNSVTEPKFDLQEWTTFSIFQISTWRCEGFLLCKRSKSTIYWDNIASIWKYLEFCRWSKLKILPEQSHFANGSPAQPSLHSQSGCPLTMPWSNCMHNNSWTFLYLAMGIFATRALQAFLIHTNRW